MYGTNPLFPDYLGFDLTQFVLVSLMSLGMGLAFVVADRESPTSRALGMAFAFVGISVYLNIVVGVHWSVPLLWFGWFGLSESVVTISLLEWILRVRKTIPSGTFDTRFGDRVLRVGQAAGAFYGVMSLALPELRVQEFLGALGRPGYLMHAGFWLFVGPVMFVAWCAVSSIFLLLRRQPDRAERARVVAMAAAIPVMAASLITPLQYSGIVLVLALVTVLIGAVEYHVLQGQRGEFMSRFLSPQVARLVSERGLLSAMQENNVEITVVCCDLRGFTRYAQATPSTQVIQVLREYYDAVSAVVADFSATIKDFAGDGVLILIGAPLPVADHAQLGMQMARRIRAVGLELTARWSTVTHPLGIGVGLASGPVTVGVIGSKLRLEYTAVGPAVNLASHLCERAGNGEILVDDRSAALAGTEGLEQRPPLPVKGYGEPVSLYALPA
jgi:class 3 adenylate cyclase